MTNLEYYGFENLEFRESFNRNFIPTGTLGYQYIVENIVTVDILYKAKHSKDYIEVDKIETRPSKVREDKVKWLLKEH